jgi:magnesium transporter
VLSGDVTNALAGEVLGAILLTLTKGDLNGRIRPQHDDVDTRRCQFMMRSKMLAGEPEEARLTDSARHRFAGLAHGVLFDKINFLMKRTPWVSSTSTKFRKIIKLFSVASVALLPPTLVASNRHELQSLSWNGQQGYPLALLLMVISALVYVISGVRGWLGK